MRQLLLIIALCLSLSMTARDFTYDGIKYTVINESNKYVETKAGYSEEVGEETNFYAGNEVEGDKLELPSKVYDNGKEYTLTQIGELSFYGNKVKEFTIPETVKRIEKGAFKISYEMTNINLPKEMESIEEEAFSGCWRLTEIELPNISTIKTLTFAVCLSLESITIPESVKTIGKYAFSMSALQSIHIPQVRVIEERAFYLSSALETVELGDALMDLNNEAFSGCSAIKSVYYNTESPVIALKSTFEDEVYEDATLYVPSSVTSKFEKAYPWYNFSKIEGIDFSGVEEIESTESSEPEFYDLNGNRIINPAPGQLIIKRQGGKSSKMIVH